MASASELPQLINIPLVLHDGSGNKYTKITESIRYGVEKIIISGDMEKVSFVALEQELKLGGHEPNSLFVTAMQAASEVIAAKMALFSSVGKAALYRLGVLWGGLRLGVEIGKGTDGSVSFLFRESLG